MFYNFEVFMALSPEEAAWPESALMARLHDAGLNDALVGLGQPGRVALRVTREGPSPEHAFAELLQQVRAALPTSELT